MVRFLARCCVRATCACAIVKRVLSHLVLFHHIVKHLKFKPFKCKVYVGVNTERKSAYNSKSRAPSREDHGWVASTRGRGGAPVCAPVHQCNLEHMQLITAAVHFHRPVRILAVKVCQFPFDAIVVVHKLAVCQYRILEQEQVLQILPG